MTDFLDRLKTALADRYRIQRELDSGGIATAYLAHDQKRDRPATINVFRPDLAASLEAGLFLQGMVEAAELDHPGILAPYDSGNVDGLLYYVMPFVEGESLRERLEREVRLSPEEALEIGSQVAAALDHAHRRGIVHRAIRPENILLREGQWVVADFGVARSVRMAAGERLTERALSPGKPYYISPEQALGDEVDERSDLYSFGAMLYEMVTGERPFEGEKAREIVSQHIATPVRYPREVQPDVPDWMSDVIVRCLEKSPDDRFERAAEVLEALQTGGESLESDGEESATGDDLGVGEIVQGAGWDFDDMLGPDVKPPPQQVYEVGPVEESAPAPKPAAPKPPPPEPIGPGADLIPGAFLEMDQMAPAAKPAPEPPVDETDGADVVGAAAPTAAAPPPHEPPPAPEERPAASAEPSKVAGRVPRAVVSSAESVRRLLVRSYDYGPELLVRIARQRKTWYYVGGGVGVVLFWLAVKALFFGPPNLHWQFITNSLVEPVQILVDGRVVQTLHPGQRDSLVLPRGRPIDVSWQLIRPRQGQQEMGEEFWDVLTSGRRRGKDVRSVITGVTSDRVMFAPRITNRTNRELVAQINPGTPWELRCNCVIPPSSRDVPIGYYPLLENSTIRFFDARRAYSGQYQEIGDISGRVDAVSGSVGVTVER